MPVQLVALLRDLGIETDSAVARGWNRLSNGSLVNAAVPAKFNALLTRDRLFGESAAQALKVHNAFCIVRVTLPQLRASQFLAAFRAAWQTSSILHASASARRREYQCVFSHSRRPAPHNARARTDISHPHAAEFEQALAQRLRTRFT